MRVGPCAEIIKEVTVILLLPARRALCACDASARALEDCSRLWSCERNLLALKSSCKVRLGEVLVEVKRAWLEEEKV